MNKNTIYINNLSPILRQVVVLFQTEYTFIEDLLETLWQRMLIKIFIENSQRKF